MSALTPTTRHNMSNLDRNPVSTGCLAKVLSEELRVTLKVLKLSRIPPQVRSLSRLLINTDEYTIPPQVVRVSRGGGQNVGTRRGLLNPACPSPGPLPIQLVVRSACQRGPATWLSRAAKLAPWRVLSASQKTPLQTAIFSAANKASCELPWSSPKTLVFSRRR